MGNYKWIVVELDHDNSDFYIEEYETEQEARDFIEGLETKAILIYGSVEDYFT